MDERLSLIESKSPGSPTISLRFLNSVIVPRTRWARRATVLALAGLLSVGLFVMRAPILRSVGSMLVVADPTGPADVIVLTVDAGAAGVLEAADLVHEGMASRVAVFAEPSDAVDNEFLRRGFKVEDKGAVWLRMLSAMGVTSVEQIPVPVNGSEAEGQILPGWCAERRIRAVIVVTTPDHSRRVRRVLGRAMKQGETKLIVRPTRVSSFDVDRWWQTRDSARTGIVELQKLLLDVLRHPISW
jgi:hypothetical protein